MVRNLKTEQEKIQEPGIVKSPPDLIFSLLAIILTLFGSVMLFSASSGATDPFAYLLDHGIHLAIAALAAVVLTLMMTPKSARRISLLVFVAAVVLLLLVLVVGTRRNSARRWLNLGFVMFQPSELAKTAVILLLALYFSVAPERFEIHLKEKKTYLRAFLHGLVYPGLLILLPAALTVAEPHLSGAIIICAVGGFMMFLGGSNILMVLGAGSVAGFAAALIANKNPYMKKRLEGLINRGADPDADMQTIHGMYAMGNGGMFGVGLGNSSMKYGYVPEPQNDFIFAIIGEELGFFGGMVIVLLFLALFARGIRLAQKCTDRFSSLVIAGISFKIILQVFLNIGVAAGALPNTGISLPFFSSGGSATLVEGLDIGIVLGLSRFCKNGWKGTDLS